MSDKYPPIVLCRRNNDTVGRPMLYLNQQNATGRNLNGDNVLPDFLRIFKKIQAEANGKEKINAANPYANTGNGVL